MRPVWDGFTRHRINPVICGRKCCTRCGRWRPVSDFGCQADNRTTRGFRVDSFCQTCRRVDTRTRYWAATAEQRELRREYKRVWRDQQRVKDGTIGNYRPHGPSVVDKAERVFLDPAPIIAEIQRQNGSLNQIALAAAAGVPPRAIYRLMVGESAHVRLDLADKLAMALDVPLAVLYANEAA